MKIKTLAIAYLIFLFISVIIACDTCDCGSSQKFNITSYTNDIYSVALVGESYHKEQIENNEVNFDKFGIFVLTEIEMYYAKNFHFHFIKPAYACSCSEPTTDDKITNIEIITNTNFDPTHLAGSNVTNYFDIVFNTNQVLSIANYFSSERPFLYDFTLLLNQAPIEEGEMNFTVKITLDGKTLDYFEFTTNSVTITNF